MANSKKLYKQHNQAALSASVSAALGPAAGGAAPVSAGLLPTFAHACALVQGPYSCLVIDTHRRHVVLPPVYLKKKRTGIQEELNAELLKYSNSLKGVPLAYDHIKVLGQHGDIFDEQGYIHLNIQASFVVFKPKNGDKLVGVINKVAVGHVGCLVHGCFNACIIKPAQLSPEQWRQSGLKLGDRLEFDVLQLDADVAGVLLIRGTLGRSRLQELIVSFDNTRTENTTMSDVDSANVDADTESRGASTPKKKKKKKNKERDAEAAEDTVIQDVNNIGMEVESSSPSKKKKKKKDKRQEVDEGLPSPTDLRNSDSSGYISDKGSLKRKAQVDPSLHDDSDLPPVKKKKKMK